MELIIDKSQSLKNEACPLSKEQLDHEFFNKRGRLI